MFIRHTLHQDQNDENKTVHQQLLVRDQGAKTIQLQMFRLGIEKIIRAINFNKFGGL